MDDTDRTLLEKAAKAAGYGQVWYLDGSDTPYVGPRFQLGQPVAYRTFQPLTDDGDAFRLACRLKLNTLHGDFSAGVTDEGEVTEYGYVPGETERTAVARRLIVRAAAAMADDYQNADSAR